jgi:signal transduction histidine kinase
MARQRIGLYRNITNLTLVCIILLSVGLFAYTNLVTIPARQDSSRQELMDLAGAIARNVDGDRFAKIQEGDENSPAFLELRDTLHLIRESNPRILYLYTMRQQGDTVQFVVDESYGFEPDAPVIGEIYPNPTAELILGFSEISADHEFTTDQWGTVLSGYAPIRDHAGEVVGLVGVDRDSSEVVQETRSLNLTLFTMLAVALAGSAFLAIGFDVFRSRAENFVLKTNRKLNLLNSIVRHDILNTLTGLIGLEDMALDISADSRMTELLAEVKNQTRKVEKQITFTRDYQNLGVHEPHWQNLRDVMQRAIATLDLGSVSLDFDFSDAQVYADELLERVFFNLIDNAMRYGKTLSRIRVWSRLEGSDLILFCEDDGVGIPSEAKEAIFRRECYQHTGFGLFLSREILGITGLSIRETGMPGKGACFEIRFPRGRFRIIP